jgi:excisionase family DNA binding protein
VTGGRSGHADATYTAAEALASAVAQLVAAAVAAALAAHRSGTGETAAPLPALLTYAQACQQLGVSRATLYKLLRAGDIRNVSLAAQVRRIPAVELDRYVAELLSQNRP